MVQDFLGPTGVAVLLCVLCPPATPASDPAVEGLLEQAGIPGGLVVHVGCGDGRLTPDLRRSSSYVVHGLDTDPTSVGQARSHIQSLGAYGPVSAHWFDGKRLPYVDNLVNLLVAEELGNVPMAEVMRVLAPRGVAMIGGKKTVKPWPDGIDEWSHYLHGPDNNALADDRVAGPPRHMQWLAGPSWTRHHHADKGTYPAIRAVVSTRGRLYYLADETESSRRSVPSRWFLVARDGFSGVLLWRRAVKATSYERRLEQVWRTILADDARVYASLGTGLPLSALDAENGAVLRIYEGTENLQEVILYAGTLLGVNKDQGVLALGVESGKLLWRWQPGEDGRIIPLTLAACEGKVFVKAEKAVCCLSAKEGRLLWRTALPGSEQKVRLRWPRERLLVKDSVVLCSYGGIDPRVLDRDKFEYLGSHPRVNEYGGKLAALSALDGSVLWRTAYRPGLESTPGEIYIAGGQVWLGPDFASPRDLQTGVVLSTRHVLERLWTTGHHYRCYPGKATSRYIITAKRGIEMIELAGENHSRNNWVRATCRTGVTPCNGLLYAPPHSCGCYMEARLYGFWALAAERSPHQAEGQVADEERLQRGPAFRQEAAPDPVGASSSSWWTHRGNPARSGSTRSAVPAALRQLWRADVGGRLGAVTIRDGRVLVADQDAHAVCALDSGSGRELWRFTAGARVDSPPTLYGGTALFGSRDGWVYCVRMSDGALVWRFLAAPGETNAVAHEQLESLWPVHGSVLIDRGIALVAAGRSSHLDGGIALWGLDPATGEARLKSRLVSEPAGTIRPPSEEEQKKLQGKIEQNNTDYKTFLAPDRSDAFSMRGALTDVLIAEGGAVFMRHLRLDERLEQQGVGRPHLFSTSSLLDGSEHHRSFWLLGTGDFTRLGVAYPWLVNSRKTVAVPYGLLLAFDDETVWGVQRVVKRADPSGYIVFATPRPDPSAEENLKGDFVRRSAPRRTTGTLWTVGLSFRPRALLKAKDVLFIGGEGTPPGGGILRAVSCGDGRTLHEEQLASSPVWDGMAAAGGRLYISLENGEIICLGR